jgi:hypothetical protein
MLKTHFERGALFYCVWTIVLGGLAHPSQSFFLVAGLLFRA